MGHCQPVPLPAGGLLRSEVNMRLRTDGVFGLAAKKEQQQPMVFAASKAYGLVTIGVPQALAASMAAKVVGSRCKMDYLQIGTRSFAGYMDYTAIPVVVDSEEQSRWTTAAVWTTSTKMGD